MLKGFQRLSLKIVGLVNSPGKTQRIIRDAAVSRMILKDFFEVIQIMDAKRYFAGAMGEVSLRASGGTMLISSRGIPMARLAEEGLLPINTQGGRNLTGKDLPSHAEWHHMIYAKSAAGYAVLCQPAYACIAAESGQLPAKQILVGVEERLGDMHLGNPDELLPAGKLGNKGTWLVNGVGVFAWGENLNEILARLDLLERWCEIGFKLTRK